jgi:hypothetical protein
MLIVLLRFFGFDCTPYNRKTWETLQTISCYTVLTKLRAGIDCAFRQWVKPGWGQPRPHYKKPRGTGRPHPAQQVQSVPRGV